MQTMTQWQARQWLESRKLKRFLSSGIVDCGHASMTNVAIKTASPLRVFVQGMLETQANESGLMPSFGSKLRIIGISLVSFVARQFPILQWVEPVAIESEEAEKPIVVHTVERRGESWAIEVCSIDGRQVAASRWNWSEEDSPTREIIGTNEVRHDPSERRTMPRNRPRIVRVISCVHAIGGYADDFIGPLPIGAFNPVVCRLRFKKPQRTVNRATYLRSHAESWNEYVKHFRALRKLVPVESQQTASERREVAKATIKLMAENKQWKAKLDDSAEFIATFNEPGRRYLAARAGNVALQYANSLSSDNGTDEDKKRVRDVVAFRKRNEVRRLSMTDAKRLDKLAKLSKGWVERIAIVLLREGSSQREIASTLSLTRPKVKNMIDELAIAAK